MLPVERLEGRTLFASYTASTVSELISRINTANNSSQADTITLAAGATFSLTAVDNTNNGATGLPVIAAAGGGLTIVGNGATIERTAGPDAYRLFDVAAGASLTLANVILQGGLARGSQSIGLGTGVVTTTPALGGAIFSSGALTLDAVTLQNHAAQGASGSYLFSLQLPPTAASGGGVYSAGTLTMTGCVVQSNQVIGGSGANHHTIPRTDPGNTGGGFIPATPGLNGAGGGIYIASGSAAISDTTFSSNIARGGAGGGGLTAAAGGNGFGGGLYAAGGTVTLRNSTVTGNSAVGGAGGIGPTSRNGKRNDGAPGKGLGGGLYVDAAASAGLDAFTKSHITLNTASSSKKGDIFGSYSTIV